MSAEIRAWFEDYERKLRSQSIQEGHSQGIQEGHSQGERSLLLRLLRARFGELPPAATARVQAADPADIERWSERLLDARTLDEVLGEPADPPERPRAEREPPVLQLGGRVAGLLLGGRVEAEGGVVGEEAGALEHSLFVGMANVALVAKGLTVSEVD